MGVRCFLSVLTKSCLVYDYYYLRARHGDVNSVPVRAWATVIYGNEYSYRLLNIFLHDNE
jgi:hypothetical protein